MNKMKQMKMALVAIPAYALATSQAFAQSTSGVDVSDAVSKITGAQGDVATIGMAVFGVVVTIAIFAWIRRGVR